MNKMREIRIEKVTLNIGAGKSADKLEKGLKLLEKITDTKPTKTTTNKRIAGWGLRPGLPIGCKVTIRGSRSAELLKQLLGAVDNKLNARQFDSTGNIAFGIPEYIDIPGVDYDPEIGVTGLQVCVTLVRPGFRIKKRRLQKKKIGLRHAISKQDAIDFMKAHFNVQLAED
ncbi:50S ribosomal protein L5 [Candidatus Woesearchaeota archaeon]|nr:50S ribosomal protein L5 [Candidatus Woesearchaeota archaeon]